MRQNLVGCFCCRAGCLSRAACFCFWGNCEGDNNGTLVVNPLLVYGQFVCFSDSSTIYEFSGADLPPMVGEAVFAYGQFKIVVGGKFLDVKNPEAEAVYNCDMLVTDGAVKKTYVLLLSYLPALRG